MSLQEMKRQPQLSPDELATSLTSLDHNLDKKLEELYIAKEYLYKKLDCIKEYNKMGENQYKKEEPDYDHIYSFSVEDTQAWSIYIKDQYQSILLYDPSQRNIVTGLAVATSKNQEILWKKDSKAIFLSFILKVDYSSPSIDAYEPHLKYFEENGYQVSKIFARYLFSACDTKYYDYYKAYAEIAGE
jgi:type IV secretory pathway VirB9-like protein